MRSGACTLQQTLTAEAASVLKHSLGLARRRGHAQVTPLHVAATLLTLRASSLRRACLKSQPHLNSTSSHPLQCRALELCFNVALNRLPTTPGPLLHSQPSLSNALIAALKRAQAHQRRGCIEQQQQQPLLTIKVELEQLIISILDDPSVSRVMREAGFSSTAVKTNIEDSSNSAPSSVVFQCYNSSGGVFSSPCSPSPSENQRECVNMNNTTGCAFRQNHNHFLASFGSEFSPILFSPPQKKATTVVFPATPSYKDDVKVVLDVFLRRRKRNTVIVGDSVQMTEGLVGELMVRLERGEVPDELKSTQFIKVQLAPLSLRFLKRDEVEMNLSALRRKVDSVGGGGAIFYVGDLKWTVEGTSGEKEEGEACDYNPVDHLVAEIGKLFCELSNTKVWLLATASYQTYMRCQMKQPPLETQWALQAVPVPSGGLGLTLHASSVHNSNMSISHNPSHMLDAKLYSNNKEDQEKLYCCEECASNYEKEAQLFKPGQKKLLPSWLQSHTTENHQKDELTQLKRKWNRLCHNLHQSKQSQNHWSNTLHGNHVSNAKIYPCYPWWPNQGSSVFTDSSSISFADSAAKPAYSSSSIVPRFRRQQSCTTIEFNFSEVTQKMPSTTTLDSLKGIEGNNNKEVKITLALGNSTFGGSGQKVENITATDRTLQRAHICKLLQENVPWQSETVFSIAEALVDSKCAKQSSTTWLFMQGTDSIGKTRLGRAIAESMFGSVDLLLHLDMLKTKENSATPFSEEVVGALRTNEKLVIMIESFDFADAQFRKFIAHGFETEKFGNLSRKEENSGQVIFILSNGGTRSSYEEEQNKDSVVKLVLQMRETKPHLESSSPCLGHKRSAELDLFTKKNSPRIEDNKVEEVLVSEQGNKKRKLSRHLSFNNLDLNMKADEEEEDDGEDKNGGSSSPISSDLTRETVADPMNSSGFVESIENRFELNESLEREREMGEMFLSRMKECFEEVYGKKSVVKFSVEGRVIEEIGVRCGSFTNSMFEKWLKDIFQSSLLQKVNFGGEEGIDFTLCWGGKGDRKSDSGFMGSCLPNNIQVNYFMD
ncbi:hypothetical protein RJT34_14869 [Clitoria ternatea]|uniref:Clp R domain-containing protein n=1 Tax=Clitoria ternatea TaxID=43366 RepID=A0AAN9JRJ4_CLITE